MQSVILVLRHHHQMASVTKVSVLIMRRSVQHVVVTPYNFFVTGVYSGLHLAYTVAHISEPPR